MTPVIMFPAEPAGHQIVGTLLAFLIVFRSQIVLDMYLEGRAHVGRIMAASKSLALEIVVPLAYSAVGLACVFDASSGKPLTQSRSFFRQVGPKA